MQNHGQTLTTTALAKMARMDPPRLDPRTGLEQQKVRARVVCRPTRQMLPDGQIVEAGESFVFVYESVFDEMEAMVETATAAEMATVKAEFDRRVVYWRQKNPGMPDDLCPHSIEGAFQHVMMRPRRPFDSVDLLGDEAPKSESKSAKRS